MRAAGGENASRGTSLGSGLRGHLGGGRSPCCHPPQFCSQDVTFLLKLFPFSASTALRQGGRGAFCGWLPVAPFPAQAGGLLPSTLTFFISLCCDSKAGRGCRPGNCQSLSGAFVYLSLSVPLLMSLHGVGALYQEDVAASCTPHSGQDEALGLLMLHVPQLSTWFTNKDCYPLSKIWLNTSFST